MEEKKMSRKTMIMIYLSLFLFDIVLFVVAIAFGLTILIFITIALFLILLEVGVPTGIGIRHHRRTLSGRIRYRIHHCDLEVLVYSSRIKRFVEKSHPMDELFDINYQGSYKRHYIKASIDEEAFIYHEEILFPTRRIPVTNPFHGFVVEFELKHSLNKKFTINHPLLDDIYPKNFVYTNGKMMRVYIPNRRFVGEISKHDNIEDEINDLTNNIKHIIEFKKEFLSQYKEDQNERTE